MPSLNVIFDTDKCLVTVQDPVVALTTVYPSRYGYMPTIGEGRAEGLSLRADCLLITVPSGFVSNGVSSPWYLRPLIPQFDQALHAAIVHDYLYTTHPAGRPWADAVFSQLLKQDGFGLVRRSLYWLGVRLGGRSSWDA